MLHGILCCDNVHPVPTGLPIGRHALVAVDLISSLVTVGLGLDSNDRSHPCTWAETGARILHLVSRTRPLATI